MFNTDKMYTFLTGYANGANLIQTQKALIFAKYSHFDQKRKGGQPYYSHPLTMACHATAMGINNDHVIATLLLHDVVEDCDVAVDDLPVNNDIKTSVALLTFNPDGKNFASTAKKEDAKADYYDNIKNNGTASLAKIIDRCHNVSSMSGVFSEAKLREYINETYTFVIPLIRTTKDKYPEYRDQMFLLKYQIMSLLEAIAAGLNATERKVIKQQNRAEGSITIEQLRNYYESKKDIPCPLTEKLIKAGYQQQCSRDSYTGYAKKMGVNVDYEKAEPTQWWHLIKSYCDNSSDRSKPETIICGELIVWMAEVAIYVEQLDVKPLETLVENLLTQDLKSNNNRRVHNRQIKDEFWEMIKNAIQN